MNASSADPGSPIDWRLAMATARRLLPPGPVIGPDEAQHTVGRLRELSTRSEAHVRDLTGMGADLPLLPGDVVDRPGWVRAASDGLRVLLRHAMPGDTTPTNAMLAGTAGVQAGAVMAYLGTRVLGQYDPFGLDLGGRLLLVAPNIIAAERALAVEPGDFRMWVCLHESTHRLQFTAVPWLRDHFASEVGVLMSRMDETMSGAAGRVARAVQEIRRGRHEGDPHGRTTLIELVQSPAERVVLDRIVALSTLLEGHADHVMDAVGPTVVPTVSTIRERFTVRRRGGGLLDRLLRGLLGVDAKVRQYALGSAFTDQVVRTVGMDGFNAVWRSPEHLPTRAEITDPDHWLRRVHG